MLPNSAPTGRAGFDWYGTVALVAGLALMLLGLNGVQTFGLVSPFVLGTQGGAIVVLVAFVWWQRRSSSPIVHLALFRVREFSAATLAAFLSFIGVAAQILLLPFYLQLDLRLRVPQVELILAVVPALMGVIGPVAGTLADRFGPRVIASGGLVLSARVWPRWPRWTPARESSTWCCGWQSAGWDSACSIVPTAARLWALRHRGFVARPVP